MYTTKAFLTHLHHKDHGVVKRALNGSVDISVLPCITASLACRMSMGMYKSGAQRGKNTHKMYGKLNPLSVFLDHVISFRDIENSLTA